MATPVKVLLAGDIGATKTLLALYERWPGPPSKKQSFRNADHGDFYSLLACFLKDVALPPVTACLGVAGPVRENQVHMTNLNWFIDGREMIRRFGMVQVHLINDLVATAVGAVHLPEPECKLVNPGQAQNGAVQAVLAPGSGLGEGFLVPYGGAFLPCASEGGHASFAPRNEEQCALLAYMRKRQSHVSVEQVCSGMAVSNLFAFMSTRYPVPAWLSDQLQQAADLTPVILGAGMRATEEGGECEVARQTLRLFLDILADEAANLVLKTLAFGGLFLGGGLAARLHPFIDPERFMAIFCRGTYADRLAEVPVRIILNPETALLGAAAYAGNDGVIR